MRDERILRSRIRSQLLRKWLFAQFIVTLFAAIILSQLIETGTIPRSAEPIIPLLVLVFVIRAVGFVLLDGGAIARQWGYGAYDSYEDEKPRRLRSRFPDNNYDDEEDGYYKEKPKRERRVGLSDDGELVDIDYDNGYAEDEEADSSH